MRHSPPAPVLRHAAHLLLGWVVSLSLAAPASAAILADFNSPAYVTGDLAGQNGWGVALNGSGGLISDVQVVAGGLSYEQGTVSHGGGDQRVVIAGRNSNSETKAFITLASPVGVGDTIYFSYLTAWHQGSGFSWFALSDDSDDNNAIGVRTEGSGRFGIRARGNSSQGETNSSITAATGETYLVVARVVFNGSGSNSLIDILINPVSTDEPLTWDASLSRDLQTTNPLDTLWFRKGNATNNVVRDFDDIRFGTTFASVVTEAPTPEAVVPEPGSAALVALGLLAMLRRRRRMARRRRR